VQNKQGDTLNQSSKSFYFGFSGRFTQAMPELEPLNADASVSVPIPAPATNGQKEEAAPGDSSWWMDRAFNEKCGEYREDLRKFEDEWRKKWNPLKLETRAISAETQNPSNVSTTGATNCCFSTKPHPSNPLILVFDFLEYLRNPLTKLMWYARFRHYLRDTSLLLCFLAIMGLPWNRPAQGFYGSLLDEKDQWMLEYQESGPKWFFGLCIAFTFVFSFFTSPVPFVLTEKNWDDLSSKPGRMTFLRMILVVEKTRESKATKRWAGIAHTLSLCAYIFIYMLSYIQTSCFEKHYSNSKSDARKFALDKLYVTHLSEFRRLYAEEGWAIPTDYTIPCLRDAPNSSFFTLSEIKFNSTDVGWQWFALNNDAVRPDSLSFWIIALVYCAKVIINVFYYDDIYNQTMLPYAEFAAKHCPVEFQLCKDALIKRK
jgi:hypothetical protein